MSYRTKVGNKRGNFRTWMTSLIGFWLLISIVFAISMPVAAWWSQDTVINIIDTCFAFMAVPTLISTLLLNGKVRQALREYFQRMGI